MSRTLPRTRITVVGAGGTGCALLPLLAVWQPTMLRIVDGDTVEAANLARQPLYGMADIGRPKASTAAERMGYLLGGGIDAHNVFLDASNAGELLHDSHIVADCTDDLHARHVLDRSCAALGIPLVCAAVHGHCVQVYCLHAPFDGHPQGLGLSDWFPGRVGPDQDGCDMRRVPAAVTTMAAARMSLRMEALLTGQDDRAAWMDVIDTAAGSWMRIHAPGPMPADELIAQQTQP